MYGGTLAAGPREAGGYRVRATLPLDPDQAAAAASGQDWARRMTIRIILVDDQELVRTGFRMVLDAQPDMTVVAEAADGLAAIEAARAHPSDVMVMDARMPRLDGVAATRRLRPGRVTCRGFSCSPRSTWTSTRSRRSRRAPAASC